MQFGFLKFCSLLSFIIGSFRSFTRMGWAVWLPLFFAWVFIPLLELFIKPDPANMSAAEEELAKKNKGYDVLLYLIVAFQYFALYEFLVCNET